MQVADPRWFRCTCRRPPGLKRETLLWVQKSTKLFDYWAVYHQNWWECTWHTYTWSYGGAKLSDEIIEHNGDFPPQDIWSQSWKTRNLTNGRLTTREMAPTVAKCLHAQFLIYPSSFTSRCVFCKVEVASFSKHPTFWKSISNINFYTRFSDFWKFLKNWNFLYFWRKNAKI